MANYQTASTCIRRWRLGVVLALMGTAASWASAGSAAERTRTRSSQAKPRLATTLDIADALDAAAGESDAEQKEIEQKKVAQAAYAESDESPAGKSVALQQPAAVAEEVPPAAPAEEIKGVESSGQATVRIFRPITEVTANVALPPGLLPEELNREAGQPEPEKMREVVDLRFVGGWGGFGYEWSATKLCHGPLYFEEINLERYGYQCPPCVQPLVSGAHFFLTVPTLPYQMTVHPPRECIYTLGYYRPGSCVPWRRNCLPLDVRAGAVEAAVAVGLVFLIP